MRVTRSIGSGDLIQATQTSVDFASPLDSQDVVTTSRAGEQLDASFAACLQPRIRIRTRRISVTHPTARYHTPGRQNGRGAK